MRKLPVDVLAKQSCEGRLVVMSAGRKLLQTPNKSLWHGSRVTLVSIATFAITAIGHTIAGPVPMPVETDLDFASYVVVGRITRLDETKTNAYDRDTWAIATIDVRRTLKGANTNRLSAKLMTKVDHPEFRPLILRPFKSGDSGIWVVARDNTVSSWSNGLLPEQRTNEVIQTLDRLEKRQWSVEVGGLKAWATTVTNDSFRRPVIIFAIKNCSHSEIFYPSATGRGVISAVAVREDGQTFKYVCEVSGASEHVYCGRLGPGAVAYLHPRYTCIDLASELKLSPATYQVVINYENSADGEVSTLTGPRTPVQAWKGKLSTPPLELLVVPR
jgi:hypothetical protein